MVPGTVPRLQIDLMELLSPTNQNFPIFVRTGLDKYQNTGKPEAKYDDSQCAMDEDSHRVKINDFLASYVKLVGPYGDLTLHVHARLSLKDSERDYSLVGELKVRLSAGAPTQLAVHEHPNFSQLNRHLICKKYEPVTGLTVNAVDEGGNPVNWNQRVEFIFPSDGDRITLHQENSSFVLGAYSFTETGPASFSSRTLKSLDFLIKVQPRSVVTEIKLSIAHMDSARQVIFGESVHVDVSFDTEDNQPLPDSEWQQLSFIDEEDESPIGFSLVFFNGRSLRAAVVLNKGIGVRTLRAIYHERRQEPKRQLSWSNSADKVVSEEVQFHCLPGLYLL